MWISTPDPLALSGQSGRCSRHFTYQALGCPAEDLPLLSWHWCKAHTDAQDAEDAQLVKTAIWDNTYTGPHTGPVHRLADYSRPARKSGAVVLWTSAVTVSPQNALSTGKGTIQWQRKGQAHLHTVRWVSAGLLQYSFLCFHKRKRLLTTRNGQKTKLIPFFFALKKKIMKWKEIPIHVGKS